MTVQLSTPLTLPCGVILPNRICKSAMTEGVADVHDHATVGLENLYRTWSRGGTGLLISGNVMVDQRYLERPGNVVVEDRSGQDALKKWANAATDNGNQFWGQVSHPGRQCSRISSSRPLSPSDVQLHMLASFAKPKPMTLDDIEDAIERYVTTSTILKESGFTGIQIHAAHGYLISQFLSPITNRREDDWGGSLENRARFLLTIVRKCRETLGSDYPISVKLNSADFQKGGFTLQESAQVAAWLSAEKIDLLEISGGTYEQVRLLGHDKESAKSENPVLDKEVRESTRLREAYFLKYAKTIQDSIDIPLMVTGGFRSRASMSEALSNNELDVVGIARPLCAHPNFSQQLLDAEIEHAPDDKIKMGRGLLGAASKLNFFRVINVQGEVAWHYQQIQRLAENKKPNWSHGAYISFFKHMSREYRIGIQRKLQQRRNV